LTANILGHKYAKIKGGKIKLFYSNVNHLILLLLMFVFGNSNVFHTIYFCKFAKTECGSKLLKPGNWKSCVSCSSMYREKGTAMQRNGELL
jgi:hypothetical protein